MRHYPNALIASWYYCDMVAALPILAVLGGLVMRMSSLRAAALGVLTAAVLIALSFPVAGADALDAVAQWWPVTLEVLLIVAGGIAFAEVGRRTGAQHILSTWVRDALGSGIGPVLAIVHGVTPFAESLTGFGVGAALAVPLLVALGLPGPRAATVGLLGLCAVPWGSMGPGTLIAAQITQIDFQTLGFHTAVVSLPVFIGVGIAAVLLTAARKERARACLYAVLSGGVLWLGIMAANFWIGTAPAGAIGGLFTLLVHLAVRGVRGAAIAMPPEARRAAVSYAVLLSGVLIVTALLGVTGSGESAARYLASPALWLFVATAVAVQADRSVVRDAARSTASIWLHVGPATALFIVLGVLMAVSGMGADLAATIARVGPSYLLAMPLVGAAGGFVTGSNTGANAMLAGPQADIAASLGANVGTSVAFHNTAAALLVMAAPARVELAVRLSPNPEAQPYVQRMVLAVSAVIVAVLAITCFILA